MPTRLYPQSTIRGRGRGHACEPCSAPCPLDDAREDYWEWFSLVRGACAGECGPSGARSRFGNDAACGIATSAMHADTERMTSFTARDMIAAIEFLEDCADVPADVLARLQSVALSGMDAAQAVTLLNVARVYGWQQ